ncbi:zinc finger protein-like 1 [Liolophura sinensis]|uniref:zinc finger protein-like 1 n=1 Tax=Liolophura sinensis TaxID=3198878 RepID=UPI0031582F7A
MGLCKCPKKKVTNLFCFEHRVNVCEHCLVANHPRCIVQSYLQWLQDSDYNPICKLCNKSLSDENSGECVRLVCYDVFHWYCLNEYAQKLPPNTAPAGYGCPTCKVGIFPASNLVSPVADTLRQMLSKVNWARTGLGLPLIPESELPPAPTPPSVSPVNADNTSAGGHSLTALSGPTAANYTRPSAQVPPYTSTPTTSKPHSVINVDTGTSVRGFDKVNTYDARKLFDTTKEDEFQSSLDADDDKYKRRPALHWLSNWFKSREGKRGRKDPNAVMKRFLMVVLIGVIGFVTVILIMSHLGRQATENDPFLDPLANPNIRIKDNIKSQQNFD